MFTHLHYHALWLLVKRFSKSPRRQFDHVLRGRKEEDNLPEAVTLLSLADNIL
jgi:hypothetical protein